MRHRLVPEELEQARLWLMGRAGATFIAFPCFTAAVNLMLGE